MDRRQEIERIVIGTILNSTKANDFIGSCRCCITPDMFSDERHQDIYKAAIALKSLGNDDINPLSVWLACPNLPADYLCELAADWSYEAKRYYYNRNIYYCDPKKNKRYTRVTFDDYINRFMELVISNGERDSSIRRGAEPAA